MTKHATYLKFEYRGWTIERKNRNDNDKITIEKGNFSKSFESWHHDLLIQKIHSFVEMFNFIDAFEDTADGIDKESK